MKYMGSKAALLRNGLGQTLLRECAKANRLFDLFAGSGAVSWFVAENTNCKVYAYDLQEYSIVLARGILGRTASLNVDGLSRRWLDAAEASIRSDQRYPEAANLELDRLNPSWRSIRTKVAAARSLCQSPLRSAIWTAYGGYYFSPLQALTFDHLIAALPGRDPARSICLASLIISATKCAAAPGHTAQPFAPTESAARFIKEAWTKSPLILTAAALRELGPRHAQVAGEARVRDALVAARKLEHGDVAFVDPPYSGVHYSRFYHVIETIARGWCSEVSGTGRYPVTGERPISKFSQKSKSLQALRDLLQVLRSSEATVVLTFPSGESSNGLSGEVVQKEARRLFKVETQRVKGRFSTMGGNNKHRAPRTSVSEMILVMRPE